MIPIKELNEHDKVFTSELGYISIADFASQIIKDGGDIYDLMDSLDIDKEEATRLWNKYNKRIHKHYFSVTDYISTKRVNEIMYLKEKDEDYIINWLRDAGKSMASDILEDCGVGSVLTIERAFDNNSTWQKIGKDTWIKDDYKMSEKDFKARVLDFVILSGYEAEGEYDFWGKCSFYGINAEIVSNK